MLFLSGLRWQNQSNSWRAYAACQGHAPIRQKEILPGAGRAAAATGEQAVWGSQGIRAVPAKAPGPVLPPQLLAPRALPLPRRCQIQRCYHRQKLRGSLGFILYQLQNAREAPLLLWLCPDGSLGPLHSLESFSSAS